MYTLHMPQCKIQKNGPNLQRMPSAPMLFTAGHPCIEGTVIHYQAWQIDSNWLVWYRLPTQTFSLDGLRVVWVPAYQRFLGDFTKAHLHQTMLPQAIDSLQS